LQILKLLTTIGAGNDKQVDKLFEGPHRKVIQITLRNNAVLAKHQAATPITIQCMAGKGSLPVEGVAEAVALTPGVLVTIEANVGHEVRAEPEVSILVTFFT
jgi:quercetin dioxygenase-like cupin family protein